MDDRSAPIAMIVLAVSSGMAVLLVASLRWVGPGQLLVVIRRGRVARVRDRRLVARIPVVEQVQYVDTEPRPQLVTVRACTADGAEVRVLLIAHLARVAPPHGAAYVEPGSVAAEAIGSHVRSAVAEHMLAELPVSLPALLPRCAAAVDPAIARHGVRLVRLELDALEHLLLSPSMPSKRRNCRWIPVS